MEFTKITADLTVSRLGFGGCPMGGHGWGQSDDDDFVRAIAESAEHGVNFFDTADIYGFGRSEELLGKSLQGRGDTVVATKYGVRRIGGETCYDSSAAWMREAAEASLRRLKRETIELFQLHYWDQVTPLEEVLETAEQLKSEGKIKHFGATNLVHEQLAALQSPTYSFEYSLLERSHEDEILHDAKQRTFLAWGSLGQGMLSGKHSRNHQFDEFDRRSRPIYKHWHGKGLDRSMKAVDLLKHVRQQLVDAGQEKTLTQISLRFVLDQVPGSVVLTGIKRSDQLRDNAGCLGWALSGELMDQLRSFR